MTAFLCIVLGYVLGSAPWGLVIARTFCGIDPRNDGSRNTGATNVARLCGFRWGVLTLACDLGKGALPVALALWLDLSPAWPWPACWAMCSPASWASAAARPWPPASACSCRWPSSPCSSPARPACWSSGAAASSRWAP